VQGADQARCLLDFVRIMAEAAGKLLSTGAGELIEVVLHQPAGEPRIGAFLFQGA
jgi:hypothetical protein